MLLRGAEEVCELAIELGGRRYVLSLDEASVVEEIEVGRHGCVHDCSFRQPGYSWKFTALSDSGASVREEEPYSSLLARLAEAERRLAMVEGEKS